MAEYQNRFKLMADALSELGKESASLDAAACLMAKAARRDALVHVFGIDAKAADIQGELFYRAGGLACINPLYDPAFSNSHGAYRSELCRPLDGLTPRILEYYEYIDPGDPLVLLAFDADSVAFAQTAAWAKAHDLSLIAVVPEPPKNAQTVSLPDVTVCFGYEYGTLLMTAVLNELMTRAVELAPDAAVWRGNFFPDSRISQDIVDKYLWRIRHL